MSAGDGTRPVEASAADVALADVPAHAARILDEVDRAVVGKRDVLSTVLAGLLANGHILIEDLPGLAKTLLARSFAHAIGLGFARIQFTPDLLPSDITGSYVFDQREATFEFRPGPVFTNILLGDEVNRAPPKTQAALLEAMQERQVTVEGSTHELPSPFAVLATQNPIEYEGTYPLPEAQLDRFLLRVGVGYPTRDDEWDMLARRVARRADDAGLQQVVDAATFRGMQAALETVHVNESIGYYIVDLVNATREHPSLEVGASPRGALGLLVAARATAALDGRDYVTPDDVHTIAVPVLAHRLSLKPDAWVRRVDQRDIVQQVLESVPTPVADPSATRPLEH